MKPGGELNGNIAKKFTRNDELAQKFEILVTNTEEPCILVSHSLEVINFNKSFETLYRQYYGKHIQKGDCIIDYSQKKTAKALTEIYNQVFSGLVHRSELDIKTPDNTYYTFILNYKPAYDESGNIIAAFVTAGNITEKKQAQQRVNASEKRFKSILEHSGDIIILLDGAGRIMYVSPSFEKLTGIPGSMLSGKYVPDIIPADFIENYTGMLTEALAGSGKTFAHKISFFNTHNSQHTYLEGFVSNLLQDEHVGAIVLNFRDTTERILANEKLQLAERRFGTLIDHNHDGIVLRDKNFKIIYANSSSEKILGWTFEDKLGKDFTDKTHPDDIGNVKENQEKVKNNPGVSFSCIFRTLHKKGHYVWVERVMTNMLHDNAIHAIVANFRDVTEKMLNEQTREFNQNNLNALINNTNDLMWSVSTEGKLITSNRAFDEMAKFISGVDVEQGGAVPQTGFSKRNIQRWKSHYSRAFKGEIFTTVEHSLLPREHWSEISFYPIHRGGKIVGTACYSRDITERKFFERKLESNTSQLLLAKSELEYSESRLKQAQSMTHIGNWEIDLLTESLEWSDECYRIYGLTPGAYMISIEEWKSYIHGDDFPEFEKVMRAAWEEKRDCAHQHRIVRKNGEVRHVHFEARFEWNEHKQPVGIYGVVLDITERVIAQEEILQSHQLLQKLTNKVPVVVYQFKIDNQGITSFPFMAKTINDLLPDIDTAWLKQDATSLFEKIHPGDLSRVQASIHQSLINLEYWDQEFRIHTPAADSIWVRGSAIPEKTDQGDTIWFGYFQNITEKKLSDEQIRLSKERYDFVAKATNDAIYDWNLITNKTTRSGDGLKTLFGYDPKAAESDKDFWTKHFHPEDYKTAFSALKKALADPGETYCNQEYRFMKADGTYAYVYDKGFIIRDKTGKAIRIIGATQDITKIKKAEFKLKELNEKLEKRAQELAHSNTELEQFAYIASHDLQEPLRMVTSFLTLLENKYKTQLDDTARQYIHFATDGATRMRKLILNLLEYSRVGKQSHTKLEVDINDLLYEAIKFNSAVIQEKKAIIDWQNLPVVTANKTGLVQVFQNLIGNALKYQKPGIAPRVKITCTETCTHWQFSISDNGIGIEARYFEKIFIVFQRLHNKDEFSGTGIGLAICKKIVENHEGRMWVESEFGKGSMFYFTLIKPDRVY